jgi:hypothetical protein
LGVSPHLYAMLDTLLQKAAKLSRRLLASQPRPEVCWGEVVRIEALGTDVLGPFEVSLTFTHADNSRVTLSIHHRGFDEIVESLPHRFPSIPPGWYEEMAKQPWHVECILYSRDNDGTADDEAV